MNFPQVLVQAQSTQITKDVILEVQKLLPKIETAWICGGSALELIGENLGSPSDIDIFFENSQDFNKMLNFLMLDGLKSRQKFAKSFETENAISFSCWLDNITVSVQLIQKSFGPIKEILNSFDMYNVKVAVSVATNEVVDLREGHKEYIKFSNVLTSSFKRLGKYLEKGYLIQAEELLKFQEASKSGKMKELYGEKIVITKEEEYQRAFIYLIRKVQRTPEQLQAFFNVYREGWTEYILFNISNIDSFKDILRIEHKRFLCSIDQVICSGLLNGDYEKSLKAAKNEYPELFLSGKRVIKAPKLFDVESLI